MANTPFLEMRGVTKSFENTHALTDVDFSASAGEVHAISGENGAGKSTLMKILSGALACDSGEISIDGQPVELGTPLRARQHGIYAVYQEFSLISHLTIAENILLGQMPQSRMPGVVDWSKAFRQADHILQTIGFDGIDVRKKVRELSVSHQQMVEIAKATAKAPSILILDEPSAVLSKEEMRKLFALVNQLKKAGTLVLYISHRLDEVFEIADRITVLKDGEKVGTVKPEESDHNQLIRMMVGRSLEKIYPTRGKAGTKTAIEVKHLANQNEFRDVSFSLKKGEILGMFGLVGSGRTQVARCIFGADPLTHGEIWLDGAEYKPKSPRDAVARGIAFITEDRKRDGLVMSCSIRDNASLASFPLMTHMHVIDRRMQATRVDKKIRELDLRPPFMDRLAAQLSGGNQQKLVLTKWLLTQASVLILDEPTRGVDVATKVEIYQIINRLAGQGMGLLLISSELPEILGMCDRTLVMREGEIVGEFSRAESNEETLLAAAAGVQH
jgi:ribose transport system ATP-binding protein